MVYFIIFLYLLITALKYTNEQNKQGFSLNVKISFVIFVCLAGLRYEIGVDWFAYQNSFVSADSLNKVFSYSSYNDYALTNSFEPLYAIYQNIIRSVTDDVQLLFFISSIISTTCLFKSLSFFSSKRTLFWSLLIYFSFVYLLMEMQATRQAMSAGFIYIAFKEFTNNKFKNTCFYLLIAFLFHYSAFFIIIIFPFLKRKISITIQITSILISLFIFIGQIEFFANLIKLFSSLFPMLAPVDRISGYLEKDYLVQRGFYITFILYLFVYILILVVNKRTNHYFSEPHNIVCQNIYFFYLIYTMLFWEYSIISIRLGWILLFGLVVLMPKLLFEIKPNRRKSYVLFMVFFNFIVIRPFFFPTITTKPFCPYQNYISCKFFDAESTGKRRAEEYLMEVK